MKISRGFALSCLLTVAAGPVFAAGFSLGDAANAISGMQGGNNKAAAAAPTSETGGLLKALTSQLNITPSKRWAARVPCWVWPRTNSAATTSRS